MAFGSAPEIIAIPDRETRAAEDILPGSSSIGRGYDIFGAYAGISAVGRQLFDLGPLVPDEIAGYRRPALVDVNRDSGTGTIEQVEGKTVRDYQADLALKAGLKGGYGFFSAEVNASFDRTVQETSTVQFVETRDRYLYFRLILPPAQAMREHLVPEVRQLIDTGSIDALLDDYGTHYLQSLLIGARASYRCAVDTISYKEKTAVAVAAKLSYQSLTGQIGGSVSAEQKKAIDSLQQNSSARIFVQGGDISLAGGMLSGKFEQWRASVPKNLAFSDLDDRSLVPVSQLAEGARRTAIDAAIAERLKAHPVAPLPAIFPVFARNIMGNKQKGENTALSRWYFGLSADGPPFWAIWPEVFFYAFRGDSGHADLVPVYRYTAGNPERYLLSRDPAYGHGWTRQDIAFRAFAGPAPDLIAIDGYNCDDHKDAGHHYRPHGTPVGHWTVRQVGAFYVPKVG